MNLLRILKIAIFVLVIMAAFCFWSDWRLAQAGHRDLQLSSIRALWSAWLEAGQALSSRATVDLRHSAGLWRRASDIALDLPAGPACLGLAALCGLLYWRTRKRWRFFSGKNR